MQLFWPQTKQLLGSDRNTALQALVCAELSVEKTESKKKERFSFFVGNIIWEG
mgnify:CR=1 FL=1